MSLNNARDQAIRQENAENILDEHKIPMTPSNKINGWEDQDLRDYVRETRLKPWLEARGHDTDNLLSSNVEYQTRIRITSAGQGLIQTPEGIILGLVNLTNWVSEADKERRSAAVEATKLLNDPADLKRLEQAAPRGTGRGHGRRPQPTGPLGS